MKLTTQQTAVRLKITDRHVRRLIAEKKLPALREGKEWLVEENAIVLYEQGLSKEIKKKLDEMLTYSSYIVANPSTIEQMQKKNLPIHSRFISYEEYLDNLFEEKRSKAREIIELLPLFDTKVGNAVAESLYNEFRECFVLGVNGAAITLAIVLLDYSTKHRLLMFKRETNPSTDWKSVEGMQLGDTIKALGDAGLLTEEEKAQLMRFNSRVRNSYMHYKIRELVKDMMIFELPTLNVRTGEVVVHKDVDVKTMPHLWFSAKKKLDATTVVDISTFCINWANKLLKPKES